MTTEPQAQPPERIYIHPTSAEWHSNRAPLAPEEYIGYVRADLPRAAAGNNDYDLAYKIVEEMGLGFEFRNCSCGQLPCLRLRPIADALAKRAAEVCAATPRAETGLTVEGALAELREMFPGASFISAKTHVIYQHNWTHQPQADIQIEDKGFRRKTLDEAMQQVRAWKEKNK